jgi:hypothetical protein
MKVTQYKEYFFQNVRNSHGPVFHHADLYPPKYENVNAVTWQKTNLPVTVVDRLAPQEKLSGLEQLILSWITNGPFGKQLREYIFEPFYYWDKRVEWRNYEASYDVIGLEPPSRDKSTYALQEYFVPAENFDAFTPNMVEILNRFGANVLNISIRHSRPDPGSLLSWARNEVFAFVIYYNQGTTDGRANSFRQQLQQMERTISPIRSLQVLSSS